MYAQTPFNASCRVAVEVPTIAVSFELSLQMAGGAFVANPLRKDTLANAKFNMGLIETCVLFLVQIPSFVSSLVSGGVKKLLNGVPGVLLQLLDLELTPSVGL